MRLWCGWEAADMRLGCGWGAGVMRLGCVWDAGVTQRSSQGVTQRNSQCRHTATYTLPAPLHIAPRWLCAMQGRPALILCVLCAAASDLCSKTSVASRARGCRPACSCSPGRGSMHRPTPSMGPSPAPVGNPRILRSGKALSAIAAQTHRCRSPKTICPAHFRWNRHW